MSLRVCLICFMADCIDESYYVEETTTAEEDDNEQGKRTDADQSAATESDKPEAEPTSRKRQRCSPSVIDISASS